MLAIWYCCFVQLQIWSVVQYAVFKIRWGFPLLTFVPASAVSAGYQSLVNESSVQFVTNADKKLCANVYFDLSKWLCFFTEPLRKNCSAAAACSSGILCTHIKTSLQGCVAMHLKQVDETVWCRNPPTHTHTHANIYLFMSCHTYRQIFPSYEPVSFAFSSRKGMITST